MIDFTNIYVYTDQPTVCPQCGARTDIILDLAHTKPETQIHICKSCSFEFVIQTYLNTSWL